MQAHNEEVLENNIAIKFLFGKQSLTNIINKNKEDKKNDKRSASTADADYDQWESLIEEEQLDVRMTVDEIKKDF